MNKLTIKKKQSGSIVVLDNFELSEVIDYEIKKSGRHKAELTVKMIVEFPTEQS